MKCVECGEFMVLRPVEKHDGFYYGPTVCSNCGRRELDGSTIHSRL